MVKKTISHSSTVSLMKSGKGESYHKLGTMNKKTVPAKVQDQHSENCTQARQGTEHCGHIAETENTLSLSDSYPAFFLPIAATSNKKF